jgi:hypothetical protein
MKPKAPAIMMDERRVRQSRSVLGDKDRDFDTKTQHRISPRVVKQRASYQFQANELARRYRTLEPAAAEIALRTVKCWLNLPRKISPRVFMMVVYGT